jgi:hypothetical protein
MRATASAATQPIGLPESSPVRADARRCIDRRESPSTARSRTQRAERPNRSRAWSSSRAYPNANQPRARTNAAADRDRGMRMCSIAARRD